MACKRLLQICNSLPWSVTTMMQSLTFHKQQGHSSGNQTSARSLEQLLPDNQLLHIVEQLHVGGKTQPVLSHNCKQTQFRHTSNTSTNTEHGTLDAAQLSSQSSVVARSLVDLLQTPRAETAPQCERRNATLFDSDRYGHHHATLWTRRHEVTNVERFAPQTVCNNKRNPLRWLRSHQKPMVERGNA